VVALSDRGAATLRGGGGLRLHARQDAAGQDRFREAPP